MMAIRPEIYEPDESLPADLRAMRRFARLMDEAVAIPGTSKRVGLDAALGLLPGIGDAAGALFSSWILVGAIRHRVPMRVFLKMLGAVLLDLTVGAIPFLGDIFDVLFKENVANVELVVRHRNRKMAPRGMKEAGVAMAIVLVILLILFAIFFVFLVYIAIQALRTVV